MKKYPHGLTLNAVCAAIEDYQRHEDSVPEEGILAAFNTLLGHSDIAEALRSMERTADANMAAAQAMRDDMYHWKQRAEAAEARASNLNDGWLNAIAERDEARYKLAELEKQEPYGYVHKSIYESCGSCAISNDHEAYHDSSSHIPLFTRPAPAINLEELVPDESALADKHIEWLSTLQRPMFSDEDWEELTLYTWLAFRDSARVQLAEILRNIEEAK